MMRRISFTDLKSAFENTGSGPILLHTDLLKIGMPEGAHTKEEICRTYADWLFELFGERTFLIPTFNYDYCKTGIYDVNNSPAQIGALPDYFRRHYSQFRTHTPVFNFCILNNRGFSLAPVENCFGEQSVFGELVRQDGVIAFLGADFSSNTFIHHVEELCNVNYRHHKQFPGVVMSENQGVAHNLIYRVRPLNSLQVDYDWPRLRSDVEGRGILHKRSVGGRELLFYSARDLKNYWRKVLESNSTFLLTKQK